MKVTLPEVTCSNTNLLDLRASALNHCYPPVINVKIVTICSFLHFSKFQGRKGWGRKNGRIVIYNCEETSRRTSLRFTKFSCSVSHELTLEVLGQYSPVWFSHFQIYTQDLGASLIVYSYLSPPDDNPGVTTWNLIYYLFPPINFYHI